MHHMFTVSCTALGTFILSKPHDTNSGSIITSHLAHEETEAQKLTTSPKVTQQEQKALLDISKV